MNPASRLPLAARASFHQPLVDEYMQFRVVHGAGEGQLHDDDVPGIFLPANNVIKSAATKFTIINRGHARGHIIGSELRQYTLYISGGMYHFSSLLEICAAKDD